MGFGGELEVVKALILVSGRHPRTVVRACPAPSTALLLRVAEGWLIWRGRGELGTDRTRVVVLSGMDSIISPLKV